MVYYFIIKLAFSHLFMKDITVSKGFYEGLRLMTGKVHILKSNLHCVLHKYK